MHGEKELQGTSGKVSTSLSNFQKSHVLVVSDDDTFSEILEVTLLHAGIASERVTSIAAACERARAGRFQVVVTTPVLLDGTWKRLTDLASRYHPGFVVIVLASPFEREHYGEALGAGAFEVLDVSHELSKLVEVTEHALWAAYLIGAGPRPEALHPVTQNTLTRVTINKELQQ